MTARTLRAVSLAVIGNFLYFHTAKWTLGDKRHDPLTLRGLVVTEHIPFEDNVVHSEIEWLAQVPGAKVITDVNDLEPGDIIALMGASQVETPFGPMGHIWIVGSGGVAVRPQG